MKRIQVLVIDDEKRFRENIVKILKKCGVDAECVGDGRSALQRTTEKEFDVLLLDMKMPGLTGEETLKEMRTANIKAEVLVLTGHASVSSALDMVELGACDYLLKPMDIAEMVKKIRLAGEKKLVRDGFHINEIEPVSWADNSTS